MPADLQRLIADMTIANRTWGEERIASELLLKLGIRVSPRTVRRYMPTGATAPDGTRSQRWRTFVLNHADAVLACDFFVTITATFRVFYVFVVLEVGTRRVRHGNVTEHPPAEWTAQQFRMIVSGDEPHRFVIHDHDSIYSDGLDRTIAAMGLTVLRTPVRSPQANAFCERVIGTIRRECLDWMISLNERHLRRFFDNGSPTTIAGVHTRAWDRAFPKAVTSTRWYVAIGFATATGSSRSRFSAVFITSTVSNDELLDGVPTSVANLCGHGSALCATFPPRFRRARR